LHYFSLFFSLLLLQIAFWGNPITSGSHHIDYFVSADVMEHPFRTRMPLVDEPYVEQVVLMEGQGIWYLRPDIEGDLVRSNLKGRVAKSKVFTRETFELQPEWFLYVLPQSVFKIHPLYDLALRDIVAASPHAHLVVTGGRRPRWTEIYVTRLQAALGPELSQRLHVIKRVSSEQFTALLAVADVILHPFPFDGSKTSADALHAGKPIVTLPTEYLRGRMGAAFLRTMNLPELVARNVSEYVDIAVRLGANSEFYRTMCAAIVQRVDLIWEDMHFPYQWTGFLSTMVGLPVPSWEEFLHLSGRDVALEMKRTEIRDKNIALFDVAWGPEAWLLNPDGSAPLETMLDTPESVPCIFTNWACHKSSSSDNLYKTVRTGTGMKRSDLRPTGDVSRTDNSTSNSNINSKDGVSIMRPPSASSSATGNSSGWYRAAAEVRKQYLSLVNVGRSPEALQPALKLLPYYFAHPLYLVELGLIHIFSGNYSGGYVLCQRAHSMVSNSSLVHGCLGLAGLYMESVEMLVQSTAAFKAAIALKLLEEPRLREKEAELRFLQQQQELLQHAVSHSSSSSNDEDAINPSSPPTPIYALVDATGALIGAEAGSLLFSPAFSLPDYALQNNLLMSYRLSKQHAQCVQWWLGANALPPLLQGGGHILVLAIVEWSETSKPDIEQLEQLLRLSGRLALSENITLWAEIRRVQAVFMPMLTVSLECLHSLSKEMEGELLGELLRDLMALVLQIERRVTGHNLSIDPDALPSLPTATSTSTTSTASTTTTSSSRGVALVLQLYLPTDPRKKADLESVLLRNLRNPYISDIYLLNELGSDEDPQFQFTASANNNSHAPSFDKIHQHTVGERLTFKTAFEFANTHLKGRTVVLGMQQDV
jgi:hypothetical protein